MVEDSGAAEVHLPGVGFKTIEVAVAASDPAAVVVASDQTIADVALVALQDAVGLIRGGEATEGSIVAARRSVVEAQGCSRKAQGSHSPTLAQKTANIAFVNSQNTQKIWKWASDCRKWTLGSLNT